MYGQVPMDHHFVYPTQNRRINPIRTGVFGQIPTTRTPVASSAAAVSAEHLRQRLRESAATDLAKVCQLPDYLTAFHPMGMAKACAAQQVRYNGTPFHDAVHNSMNVLKTQYGDSAIHDLVPLLGAMIAQETDLTASQGQAYMWQEAARVGVTPQINASAVLKTSSASVINPAVAAMLRPLPTTATMTPVPLLPALPGGGGGGGGGGQLVTPPPLPGATSFPEMTTLPAQMPGGGALIPSGEEIPQAPSETGGGGALAALTSRRTLLYLGIGLVVIGGGYYFFGRRKKR